MYLNDFSVVKCGLHSNLIFVDRICYGGQTDSDPRPFSENYLPIFIRKPSFFTLVDSGTTISTVCTKHIKSNSHHILPNLPYHKQFIQGVTGNIKMNIGRYNIKFTANDGTYEGIFHEKALFNKILKHYRAICMKIARL